MEVVLLHLLGMLYVTQVPVLEEKNLIILIVILCQNLHIINQHNQVLFYIVLLLMVYYLIKQIRFILFTILIVINHVSYKNDEVS